MTLRSDCDHKGHEKVRDASRNPDPDVVAETRVCAGCGHIFDIRLKPPGPQGKP